MQTSLSLLKGLSLIGCVSAGLTLNAPGTTASIQPVPVITPTAVQLGFDSAIASFQLAQSQGDIIDTAASAGSFQTFIRLLNELGMTEDLRGYGRFTVFAPTDAAFSAVPRNVFQALSSDRELLAKVLAYHAVVGQTPLFSRDIATPTSLTTLERSEVRLTRRGDRLYVNNARVIDRDIEASNGVIHAINQVLIPADISTALPH